MYLSPYFNLTVRYDLVIDRVKSANSLPHEYCRYTFRRTVRGGGRRDSEHVTLWEDGCLQPPNSESAS
jgi:hypothetical protein